MEVHCRIKDWPAAERPREKLLQNGAHALSDAELLAILIRSGIGGCTALDLARSMLTQERGLRGLRRRNCAELMRTRGIGEATAITLVAALEIGRRAHAPGNDERVIIRGPEDVARCLLHRLRDLRSEVFWILVLDSGNGVKFQGELSRGTLNASLVHPREVYKCAIDNGAASVIVAHNHPSGNPEPSREDVEITRQLAEAGKIIGIPLHDHVIMAGDSYTSLAERGFL